MRQVTGRPFILVFGPVYHGNSTSLSASMSSDANTVGTGAAAFNTGIIHVPYPDTAESPFRDGTVGNAADVLHYLRNWVLQYQIDPSQVAGVIIEPITTEGGVSAPSQEFWNGLQALCREHDWILTVDEVQTGMGRCGTVYCVDRWGVDPDLILLGKGLSAGGPAIAAILGSERTLGNTELTLGSTFGWQPAACAAANAGLDILTDENTLPHVQHLEEIANRLLLPLTGLSHVTRIRAHGATVAVTYRVPNPVDNTGRDGEYTSRIHSRLLSEGVLGIGESDKNYYRFQPSLLIPDEQWEYALSRLAAAVADPALLSP